MIQSGPDILLIEDDDTIAMGVVRFLELQKYTVRHVVSGESGLEAIARRPPDLILLDWMLPGMDGIEVLKAVKTSNPGIPIILLTARTAEGDRVLGLDSGADDYLPKPFSLRELGARIRARLRGSSLKPDMSTVLRFGNVKVDLRHRLLTKNGKETRLTTHEAGVLAYLTARPGDDVPREELLEKVWGCVPTIATRTVDNQILKLRKKIEDNPNDPRHILTVYGTGYRFEP